MNIALPSPFFCAPMAEITTPALRRVIRRFSRDVVLYSEMLHAGAIAARAKHNEPLTATYDFDAPLVYQIVGGNPDVMAGACRILSDRSPYAIDINMGCSAPAVMKTGGGAKLLADLDTARSVVRACRRHTPCGLSVKMRSGFDSSDPARLADFTAMLQDEGVDFIALHPRHAKLGFRGAADWRLVRMARERLAIPVIGCGDITTAGVAIERLQSTGCAGVMIGREAVKSPWIFRSCADLLRGEHREYELPVHELFITVLRDIQLYLPEKLHKSRGHRFCRYYSKNAYFSHDLFTKIRREDTIDGMICVVDDYFGRNPHEKTRKEIHACG